MRRISFSCLMLVLGALTMCFGESALLAQPAQLSKKNAAISQNLFRDKRGSKGNRGHRGHKGHKGHKGSRGKRGYEGEDAIQGHFWGFRVDPGGTSIADQTLVEFPLAPPIAPVLKGFTTSSSTSSGTTYDTVTSNLGHGIYKLIFNVQGNNGSILPAEPLLPAEPFNLLINGSPTTIFLKPGLSTATQAGNYSIVGIIDTRARGLTLPIFFQLKNLSGEPITLNSSNTATPEPSVTVAITKIG